MSSKTLMHVSCRACTAKIMYSVIAGAGAAAQMHQAVDLFLISFAAAAVADSLTCLFLK